MNQLQLSTIAKQHSKMRMEFNSIMGSSHSDYDILHNKVATLLDEMRAHFTYEGIVLDSGDFLEINSHKDVHYIFLLSVTALLRQSEVFRQVADLETILSIILRFLDHHTKIEDEMLATYLNIENENG
jgi:hemerythrin